MFPWKILAIVLVIVFALPLTLWELRSFSTTRFMHPPPTGLGPPQGFDGNITLGPIRPICQVNATVAYATPPWSNINGTLSTRSGRFSEFSIPWKVYENCNLIGDIGHTFVQPGTYFLDISYCSTETVRTFGCLNMPFTIVLRPLQIIHLKIDIDTGIR